MDTTKRGHKILQMLQNTIPDREKEKGECLYLNRTPSHIPSLDHEASAKDEKDDKLIRLPTDSNIPINCDADHSYTLRKDPIAENNIPTTSQDHFDNLSLDHAHPGEILTEASAEIITSQDQEDTFHSLNDLDGIGLFNFTEEDSVEKILEDHYITSPDNDGIILEVQDGITEEDLMDSTEIGHINSEGCIQGNTADAMLDDNSFPRDNKENAPMNVSNELEVGNEEYTKKGNVRKRKKKISVAERISNKVEEIKKAHCVKQVCPLNCKLKCRNTFSQNQRIEINNEYWALSEHMKKAFVMGSIKKMPVKRPTAMDGASSRRKNTLHFYFKNEQNFETRVCKAFFLSTLGYKPGNDRVIQNATKDSGLSPKIDNRKGKPAINKIDTTLVVNHIKSFKPKISHYRREHAPKRLYLPSDLTISDMYKQFIDANPNFKCSYDIYRGEVKKMNISFVKLGHEECEACEHFHSHCHDKDNLVPDCCDCIYWSKHIDRAKKARELYQQDKDVITTNGTNDHLTYSMDFQKVIMLPRLDMFKSVIFAYRLSVYNLTFAPLGPITPTTPVVPVLWHEAISGRKQEDIISGINKFLNSAEARDVSKIIIWADNCTAQNKNWALMTFLVQIVNSNKINADEICLKYFEPGHTFMSADSFHHCVEKSFKTVKHSKVYDFDDFVEATEMAGKHVSVKIMAVDDFHLWRSSMSTKKVTSAPDRPYLRDIISLKVERGSFVLHYKTDYSSNEWKTLDFLQVNVMKNKSIKPPKLVTQPRGISEKRKSSLLNLLTGPSSVVPQNRSKFWMDIPTSNCDSEDSGGDCTSDECS